MNLCEDPGHLADLERAKVVSLCCCGYFLHQDVIRLLGKRDAEHSNAALPRLRQEGSAQPHPHLGILGAGPGVHDPVSQEDQDGRGLDPPALPQLVQSALDACRNVRPRLAVPNPIDFAQRLPPCGVTGQQVQRVCGPGLPAKQDQSKAILVAQALHERTDHLQQDALRIALFHRARLIEDKNDIQWR
jgi:hypothetical protein